MTPEEWAELDRQEAFEYGCRHEASPILTSKICGGADSSVQPVFSPGCDKCLGDFHVSCIARRRAEGSKMPKEDARQGSSKLLAKRVLIPDLETQETNSPLEKKPMLSFIPEDWRGCITAGVVWFIAVATIASIVGMTIVAGVYVDRQAHIRVEELKLDQLRIEYLKEHGK